VTDRRGYRGIVGTGAILNNRDRRFAYTFPQSANNYGRKRGCVCFFDLRGVSDADLRGDGGALDKYYFLNPEHCADNPIFLVLGRAHHADLIPWTAGNPGEARIPFVEAWYQGRVELATIESVLDVRVERSR